MNTPVTTLENQASIVLGTTNLQHAIQEDNLLRIERIATRLFGVAHCIVSFKGAPTSFSADHAEAKAESAFCDSLPLPSVPLIVNDTRLDPQTATNQWVAGAPYIRFYAAQPILHNGAVIGAIFLIDYEARQYKEEDIFLLSDLAELVELELQFGAMQIAYDDLVKQNRILRRENMLDPILGTWNRSAIVRSLEIEVQRCKESGKPLSLAMISVDNFAAIKNEFGLHISESILIRMVSRVRSCIRPFDALGRYGLEEFLIVLPGASHMVIQAVSERIRSTLLTHTEKIEGKSIDMTVCVGTVSTDVFVNADSNELMNQVESTLHKAQKMGNNHFIHAVPA
jgi:diguanylate cyclase (GGDEF)-like protein